MKTQSKKRTRTLKQALAMVLSLVLVFTLMTPVASLAAYASAEDVVEVDVTVADVSFDDVIEMDMSAEDASLDDISIGDASLDNLSFDDVSAVSAADVSADNVYADTLENTDELDNGGKSVAPLHFTEADANAEAEGVNADTDHVDFKDELDNAGNLQIDTSVIDDADVFSNTDDNQNDGENLNIANLPNEETNQTELFAVMSEDEPALATGANKSVVIDNANLNVGDIVTATFGITATGGVAYGFTTSYQFKHGVFEFLPETFVADNEAAFPGIELPAVSYTATRMSETYGGYIRITYAGDDVLFEDGVTKTLTLKFKVVGAYTSNNNHAGFIANPGQTIDGLNLFIEKSFDIAALQEDGVLNATKIVLANQTNEQRTDGLQRTIVSSGGSTTVYPYPVVIGGVTNGILIRPASDSDGDYVATAYARVGEYVDVLYSITSNRDIYGYAAYVNYGSAYIEFDKAATIAANPDAGVIFSDPIIYASTQNNILITRDSDGETVAIDEANPLKLVLKFRVTNSTTNRINFVGGSASYMDYGAAYLTDPTARLSDIFNENGAMITLSNRSPQINTITTWSDSSSNGFLYVTPSFTATMPRDDADLAAKPTIKVGETGLANLIINAEVDAYGFVIGIFVSDGYYELITDTAVLIADNPQYAEAIRNGVFSIERAATIQRIIWENDGSTKIIKSGESFTFKLRFRIQMTSTGEYYPSNQSVLPATLLTDSNAFFKGENGILTGGDTAKDGAGDYTLWLPSIQAAERAGTVCVGQLSVSATFKPAYSASITFSDGAGVNGTSNPEPFTVTATINNDTDKPVYGFSVGLLWQYLRRPVADGGPASGSPEYRLSQGIHVLLDEELTKKANPGINLDMGEHYQNDSSHYAIRQMWVDSDGETVLIPAGEKLTFKIVLYASGGWSETVISQGSTGDMLALISDPFIRIQEEGEGLTKLNFINTLMNEAESAGKLIRGTALGSVTGNGSKIPTQYNSLSYGLITLTSRYPELTLMGNNYYKINNGTDLVTFAAIVNSGDNSIKGAVVTDQSDRNNPTVVVAPPYFQGIGTEEYPFKGDFAGMDQINQDSSASRIVVNRSATAENGGSVGGLVNVLGSGGAVRSLTFSGNVAVSGSNSGAAMNIGGIVGKSDGGVIASINSSIDVTVADGINANVGGFAGYFGKSSIPNMLRSIYNNGTAYHYAMNYNVNTGTISGGTNVGGIVGLFAGEAGDDSIRNTILGSSNSGNVSGTAVIANVGGIAGCVTGGIISQSGNGISYNYNADPLKSYKIGEPGAITSGGAAGGVVGSAGTVAVLFNVYNIGPVTGRIAGGIAGTVSGKATVTETWFGDAEGITYLPNPVVTGSASAGGIAGQITSADAIVTHNFSVGEINGNDKVGGITGSATATPSMYKSNYYLTGTAASDALDARSTDATQLIYRRLNTYSPIGKYVYNPTDAPELDEEGYYLLRTPTDFIWFANKVNTNTSIPNNGVYGNGLYDNEISGKLMENIDLVGEIFTSIGTGDTTITAPGFGNVVANTYQGTFDGNGFSITAEVKNWRGGIVFKSLGGYAVVKNLTIRGSVSGEWVAGLTENMYRVTRQIGDDITNLETVTEAKIINCINRATVNGTSSAGGLVVNAAGQMIDCINYGEITSSNYAGGIAAEAGSGATFLRCKNFGKITSISVAGGIAGSAATSAYFGQKTFAIDCENYGDITSTNPTPELHYSASAAGGIFGSTGSTNGCGPFLVEGCINKGTVRSTRYAGGIIGYAAAGTSYQQGEIMKSSNYGDVILTYTGNNDTVLRSIAAGGIVGAIELNTRGNEGYGAAIEDNYNGGTVRSESGFGLISSIGSTRYGGTSGITDEVASNNTTSILNGTETTGTLGNALVAPKEPPETPVDPETVKQDDGKQEPPPVNPQSPVDGTEINPGNVNNPSNDEDDSNEATVIGSGEVPLTSSVPSGQDIAQPPTVLPASPDTVQVLPDVNSISQIQIRDSVLNRLPISSETDETIEDEQVPVANLTTEDTSATNVTEEETEAVPEVAPPVVTPQLEDTVRPEVIRETVENNAIVIAIIVIAVVVVLAGLGVVLIKRKAA